MIVEFKLLGETGRAPEQAHPGDAGYDLFAAESARIGPGGRASVGTGIAVAIPDGYAGLVLPRSGLALRHGIALVNSPGLIDSGYRGELRMLLLNTDREAAFEIAPRDRIAQLVITRVEDIEFAHVDALAESVRAEDGFGSTDVS